MKQLLLLGLLASLMLFTACLPTPEADIVVNKAEGRLGELIEEGIPVEEFTVSVDPNVPEREQRTLRSILGAPEHMTDSLKARVFGGRLEVVIDADVIVPDVTKLPVYSAELLELTPEEKERITKDLLGDGPYCSYNDSIAERQQLLSEIQRFTDEISNLEQRTDLSAEEKKRAIEWIKPEMNQFTRAYSKLEVDETMYPWRGSFTDERFSAADANNAYFSASMGHMEYGTMLTDADDTFYNDTFHAPTTEEELEAVRIAQDFLKRMDGTETMATEISWLDEELRHHNRPVPEPTGSCRIRLFPMYGGIPSFEYWTDHGSDTGKQAAGAPEYIRGFDQQHIEVVVKHGQVAGVGWVSALRVLRTENENVRMLAFPEILEIFKKQVPMNFYLDPAEDGQPETKCGVWIGEIRLSMMRVNKPDSDEYWILPVWDFIQYGTPDDIGKGNRKHFYRDSSMLTVNAIDGSVINRYVGY